MQIHSAHAGRATDETKPPLGHIYLANRARREAMAMGVLVFSVTLGGVIASCWPRSPEPWIAPTLDVQIARVEDRINGNQLWILDARQEAAVAPFEIERLVLHGYTELDAQALVNARMLHDAEGIDLCRKELEADLRLLEMLKEKAGMRDDYVADSTRKRLILSLVMAP